MSLPSQAEIDSWARDVAAALLPSTGNILEKTSMDDGQGSQIDTWGTVSGGSGIKCRIDAFSSKGSSSIKGNEALSGGAMQAFGQWILTLPAGTSISVRNRFEVNGGRTYNIVTVDTGKSWEADIRCIVEQL